MSQPSSETVSKPGIRALIAFITTSFTLESDTKDKITEQIVGFGRALMFTVFGDGDPLSLYQAYAKKVREFGIPDKLSMLPAIHQRCVEAREVWLASRFNVWTMKLGKLGSMSHDDAIAVIQEVGTEITGLSSDDLAIVMKENERHGLAATVRGVTLVHQFDGSPQLAAKIDTHLGVITIVEPTSAVLHALSGNGADQVADVEVSEAMSATAD